MEEPPVKLNIKWYYPIIIAVLVTIWFGDEAFTGQNICVTSCISLAGMTNLELVFAVAILPALLVIYGAWLKVKEVKEASRATIPSIGQKAPRQDSANLPKSVSKNASHSPAEQNEKPSEEQDDEKS